MRATLGNTRLSAKIVGEEMLAVDSGNVWTILLESGMGR